MFDYSNGRRAKTAFQNFDFKILMDFPNFEQKCWEIQILINFEQISKHFQKKYETLQKKMR